MKEGVIWQFSGRFWSHFYGTCKQTGILEFRFPVRILITFLVSATSCVISARQCLGTKYAIFLTVILQGNVATLLRCGGSFAITLLQIYCPVYHWNEPCLRLKLGGVLFFASPIICIAYWHSDNIVLILHDVCLFGEMSYYHRHVYLPGHTTGTFLPRYHPRPLRLPLPQDWGSQPQPKTAIAIISVTDGWSYELQIWRIHSQGPSEQKPVKNFGEKGAWAYPGTAQIFGVPLLSQEWVKLRTSNFVCTFSGSIGTKVH